MTNNDILRRLRYTFNFDDQKMMELFQLGGKPASRAELSDWLKKDDDAEFQPIDDTNLEVFLNGLIIQNRGKKEGMEPTTTGKLDNNGIFRKLKIALNLKDEDILEILKLADFRFSKHELSALFRKPDQDKYRPCKDQVLRNFLQGLQMKFRPTER
jgi:uncharacterized protein YehS (DUF1456 family)